MRQDFVDECARVMMACTASQRDTVRECVSKVVSLKFIFQRFILVLFLTCDRQHDIVQTEILRYFCVTAPRRKI